MTPETRWDEITLLLLDDQLIRETNREYFAKDRPTDVISFRYEPIPGEEDACSGDVLVNCDRAVQEGPNHDGINHELALYIAHGIDHLSGADDATPAERQTMRKRELKWLEKADAHGLLAGLTGEPHA